MSSYSDPTKLFSVLQERAKTQAEGSGSFGNQNILKLEKGQEYKLRLLWLPSEDREYPMINQYVHRIWDNDAIGSKDVTVVCPTSQYDEDNAGFKSCPICERMSALYNEYKKNGSKSAKELYDKFKRTLRGYVPVYVVNGPEKDLHQIKILQYSIQFKRFFDEKIYGLEAVKKKTDDAEKKQTKIAVQEDDDDDEIKCVGIKAFMYYNPKADEVVTTGYNLKITVGVKKIDIGGKLTEVPDYNIRFLTKKETTISSFGEKEITPEYFKSISDMLNFDKDFFKMSNKEELAKFKMKYIDGVDDVTTETEDVEEEEAPKKVVKESVDEDDDEIPTPKKPAPKKVEDDDDDDEEEKPVVKKVEEDDDDDEEEEEKPVVKKKATVKKAEPKKPIKVEKADEDEANEEEDEGDNTTPADDSDDINIDDLLKDI